MERLLARGLLAAYLLVLTWLILLKTSFSLGALMDHHHQRSLNLVPFAAPSRINGQVNYSEMVANALLFIPFGLLLDVNFKRSRFLNKLTLIFLFSVTVEIVQYLLAIGATDITDVINNVAGGLAGLLLYRLAIKVIAPEKLNRVIIGLGYLLLMVFVAIYLSHYIRRLRHG